MRAVLVLLLLAGALFLCSIFDIPGRAILTDNQIFFFLSERAAAGVPPHVSMADPKTQLSVLVTAAVMAVTAPLGVDSVIAFRATSILSVLASVWLAYRLAFLLSGHLMAGVLAAAALSLAEGLFLEGASGGRPHVFVVTCILAAHVLFAKRRDGWAGFAACCAFLCWQPSAVVLGSIGLSALLAREAPLRRAVRIAIGAVAAGLLYESYFLWHGILREQLFQEFVLPMGSIHEMKSWGENLWFVLTDARAYRVWPRFLPAAFVVVVMLRWLSWLTHPQRALSALRMRPEITSFWLAAHLGFLFTVYEHQAHPDLLLVQPYYAVAFGWLVAEVLLLGQVPQWRLRFAWVVVTVLSLAAFAEGRRVSMGIGAGASYKLADQRAIADAMRIYFDHRRSVWMLGPTHLLGLLHESNWTGYAFFWDDLDRHMDTSTYRPLQGGRMPEVIITSRGLVPGQAGWRRLEYTDITPPRFQPHNIRVFARKPDADAIEAPPPKVVPSKPAAPPA